ncbi:MAG: hypothetical protein BroJett003_04990 [Planctomycetota bacterium]|nr:MAG: hypothetical protein BroJett003_04990 [Planctomycetota bacterium]
MKTVNKNLLIGGWVMAVATSSVFADFRTATVKVGDPLKTGTVRLVARDKDDNIIPGKDCRVEITAEDLSAERKAAKIKATCVMFDIDTGTAGELKLKNLNPAIRYIDFSTGDTAELGDSLRTQFVSTVEQPARVVFESFFEPFDVNLQPAIFRAGIVTDVGELSVQVSAAELNFQTEGPIICQALFQRLAPRAPQYGAQINYAGDRLEVYFDPAYTVTQGGVLFGTTSPSPGCSGGLPLMESPCVPSDECNGAESLKATTTSRGCGCQTKAVLKGGTPGMNYTLEMPSGDCIRKAANNRGKVVVKECPSASGAVRVTGCDIERLVTCP